MRCFIAIDIKTAIIARIAQMAEELKSETSLADRDVKWVRPENMHLTLKFLGDVDLRWIGTLHKGLKVIVDEHGSFDMTVRNVGSFGKPPRVLWTGIENGQPLKRLQTDIENFLLEEGFPKEKKQFQSHLTLCRIKNQKAGRMIGLAAAKYADRVFGTTSVTSVNVYESRLTPAGPVYTKIDSCQLA